MAILVNPDLRLLVQGITGHEGSFHTERMIAYGTRIVAGVSPGKGGQWEHGKPVFDTVKIALEATEANATIIFVPPDAVADAVFEAVDAGLKLIVCITEGTPVLDVMRACDYANHNNCRLIGPNSPGILVPGLANIGIYPAGIDTPGNVGVVSRSGAMTYEVVYTLSEHNMGQTTCVGIGGDPVIGTSFVEILELFENDPSTERIVILGEIGGNTEIDAAEFIKHRMTKPIVAFIAGKSAPEGTRMGHAGAIIEGGMGTAQEKILALQEAGVRIAHTPDEIPHLLR